MFSTVWWLLFLLECQTNFAQHLNEEKRNGVRRYKAKALTSNAVEKYPLLSDQDEDCILEMTFLLDSSESASAYKNEKKFVSDTVDRLKGMQLASRRNFSWRMALIQYSSTVLIEQSFRDWKGPDNFKDRIAPITYIGHGTYTTYAITNLTQLYMNEGTQKSVKVAILLTDGRDHPRNPDISTASTNAKNYGITFFMVGLSHVAQERSNSEKLHRLASAPPTRFVYNLMDEQIVEKILKEVVRTGKIVKKQQDCQ